MCILDGLNKMNWSTGIIMLGLLGRLESTEMKPPTGIVPSKNIEKTNSVSKIELNYVCVGVTIPYGSKQVLRRYSTPQIIPRRLCKSKLRYLHPPGKIYLTSYPFSLSFMMTNQCNWSATARKRSCTWWSLVVAAALWTCFWPILMGITCRMQVYIMIRI